MMPKHVNSFSLNEEYFYVKHPSGLSIYVYPKRGYSSNYAIIGTNFGSINNKFREVGQESYVVVPDGIAHYLEHKLFASEQGDAFELFAKTGASANAYTSFDKTAYLFSCTENFEQSLNILLDFVQSPYFTKENVEKERGIIGQEIKMYEDDPEWSVLINLLNAMYHNHPVKNDIAGSIESISTISPDLLYTCYDYFYNLNNMTLCVVGDFDVDKIFTIIDKKLKYSKPVTVERYFLPEPNCIVKNFVSKKFDIKSSIFSLGFKDKSESINKVTTEQMVYTDIIINILSSPSSDLYNELLKRNLINISTFSSEYFEGPGYSSIIFSGESSNCEKTADVIKNFINKIHKQGIKNEDFERAKRAVYGRSVSLFDKIKNIANVLLDFDFSGRNLFEYVQILQNATIGKANARLSEQLICDNSALSVAVPEKEE